MLRSIQLENFKAFGQRTVIPLAPITLIFGQNSSGKSSILQSLNLLKQTRESRDVEALLLPRTENGFADLGSFQEMLFDHDLNRTLTIRIDVALDDNQRRFMAPRIVRQAKTIGLELSFSRKKKEDEITLDGFKLCGEDNNRPIATFEKCDAPREMRRYAGMPYRAERRRSRELLKAAKCTQVASDATYWQPAFDWSVREKSRLIGMLTEVRRTLQENRNAPETRGAFDEDEQAGHRRDLGRWSVPVTLFAALEDYIQFLSSDFSIDEYVQRMIKEELNQIVALDGFIPVLPVLPGRDQSLDSILSRGLGRPGLRREWTLDVGATSIFAGRAVEQALGSLFPLGPYRKPPSRWYMFAGTTPRDVGYQGHLLPDLLFRDSELRQNTNEWLKKLDIGYEIKIPNLGERSSDLFELRLLDLRRKTPVDVGLSDVGFGIGQILPFVVQSLAASDQIISVEQPEVHIHPRLQADLGDLLIEAIKEPRRNQFIIETHSEHLILRLLRRIRETAAGELPPGALSLRPEDVAVLYVKPGPEGSEVIALPVNTEGDFDVPWPDGFFSERAKELF